MADQELRRGSPLAAIPLDPQQGAQLTQAEQLLLRDAGCLVETGQQVSPNVLLLQAEEEVLHLEDGAQTPPLRRHPFYLLLLCHLLLGSEQLQQQRKVSARLSY